jgi:hypothetical protein
MNLVAVLLFAAAQDTLEASLAELFGSLTEDQRQACLKPYDDANRDAENFPPGERPGLLIGLLNEEQLAKLDRGIRTLLSEDGYRQTMEVAKQSHRKDGLKSYYLNFFGEPGKDPAWAFRVSEHHLTLVHVHSDPKRFGPILLGANPPELWKEQEEAALNCYAALTDADRAKCVLKGKAASGSALADRGLLIGDLSEAARAAADAMVEARLGLFAEEQRKKLKAMIEERGGVGKMRLAFFGELTRRCADGGRADWKIEGAGFLCDYESSRGHIHMTLRVRPSSK